MNAIIYTSIKRTELSKMNWNSGCPISSFSSMGADLADINNDGYRKYYTTDMIAEEDYRLKTTGVFDNIDLYRSKIKAGFYQQFVRNCLQLNNGSGWIL